MIVRAPAKVNLTLKILGKRTDGYHFLESLFTPISIFDQIELTQRLSGSSDVIRYKTPEGLNLSFENDIIAKTLKLFREISEVPPLTIDVVKTIPTGAGLGGGSSNAAAVLLRVQERWGDNTTALQLPVIAEKTGADVPFFLESRPALVSGIGEKIDPFNLDSLNLLVWNPPFKIHTTEAYGWFDDDCALTPRHDNVNTRNSRSEVSGRRLGISNIVDMLQNDLEKPVEARHPEIAVMKKALRNWGALGALMSGTGSSVYGIFRSPFDVEKAREKLRLEFSDDHVFFICKTL